MRLSSLQAWPTRGKLFRLSILERALTSTITNLSIDPSSCRSRTPWTYFHLLVGRRFGCLSASHLFSCSVSVKSFSFRPLSRMAIWLILQEKEQDFFVLLAVVCSGWVPVNAGTHRRSIAHPAGNMAHGYVGDGNCMCSRNLGTNQQIQKAEFQNYFCFKSFFQARSRQIPYIMCAAGQCSWRYSSQPAEGPL